jgi:agmatine/peptidylarginine deiminase
MIMSWPTTSPSLNTFFCQLVDNIQDYTEIWMVVNDQNEEDHVKDVLASAGVPLTNIIFMHIAHDAIWARDFGPFYMRSPLSERHMTDSWYYTSRPSDDVVPYRIAAQEGTPSHEAHLSYEGGNFQSDGHGNCFCTEEVYNDNSSMTDEQIRQIFREYLGCKRLTVLKQLIGEGTGHIDMSTKMLSPTKWLVGQYPFGDTNHQTLEDNASLLASLTAYNGQPYEVIRIPMPTTAAAERSPDTETLLPRWDETDTDESFDSRAVWRTHTNSSIADQLVLVPTFGKGTDAEALQIYEDAMPGYDIVGIDSEAIIPSGGAMHCVMMEVPEYHPYEGLAFQSVQNLSEINGNGNGIVEPGETWSFDAVLENRSAQLASSVSSRMTINASLLDRATMLQDSSSYEDIPGGGTSTSLSSYIFALAESYPCGEPLLLDLVDVNSSLGNDPDQPRSLTITVGDETVVTRFWDDMEAGSGGWDHGAYAGGRDYWHMETDPGCFEAQSPVTQWVFNKKQDCTYGGSKQTGGHLTSQSVSGISSSSKLSFGYWREVDSCPRTVPGNMDLFRVEVSDDDFATSTTLLDLSCKNPSHAVWIDDEDDDLSAFAGSSIKVRFIFDSVTSSGNEWRGAGVDDVLIEDRDYFCQPYTPPLPAEVPVDQHAPGELLMIVKNGNDLSVTWDMDCNEIFADYAIYRGTIASLAAGVYDHLPVVCADEGHDRTETIEAGEDSYYFIVVSNNSDVEGSYGSGTAGERPSSSSECFPAGGGSCQ